MADNINFNTISGKHSFFSVKEKAWHKLGQVVENYPTSEQAIKYAGLDYQVVKSPLFTNGLDVTKEETSTSFIDDDGIFQLATADQEIENFYATTRTDTKQALGVVGKYYQVVQNTEAFAFFDAIVGGGNGILYETAGALGKGERIFITAKLPSYIRVGNSDDVIENYIFLTNSHDGTGSITAAFTPVRIVCQNTLNAAFRNMTNVVRIRHTGSAEAKLKEAHKIMGLNDKFNTQLEGIFNDWAKVRTTDKQVKKLIELALAPNKEVLTNLTTIGGRERLSTRFKNTVNQAFEYAMSAESQQMETTKGTLFGAYNAVTGYFQNVREFKSEETKLQSIVMGGSANQMVQKSFDLCNSFEKFGSDIFKLN